MKILVDTLHDATVVPTAAVQHTTTEDFVYVINSDHTVATQKIVMGPASGDDTVIKSGLLPGQKIVINGADKLINGSKVLIEAEHSKEIPVKTASIAVSLLG